MKRTLLLLACLLITNITFGKRFLAKFEFNENADDKYGKIHTTVHGATLTTDRHGRENSAYVFDGIDDFIDVPAGLLNVKDNASFSIETYALIEQNSGTWTDSDNITHNYAGGALFSVYGASNSNDLMMLWYNNGSLMASHRTDPLAIKEDITVPTAPEDFYGKYHHIVLVRNAKKQIMNLFIDGVLVASKNLIPVKKIKEFPSLIGTHYLIDFDDQGEFTVNKSLFFKGKIDYLRIHKRALSPKRVKEDI